MRRTRRRGSSGERPGRTEDRPLRIAWTGVDPAETAGVAYLAHQLFTELALRGVAIDLYTTTRTADLPPAVRDARGVRIVSAPSTFAWERWYSRSPLPAFVSALSMKAAAQARLTRRLMEEHRRRPYDVIYQFSQPELLALHALRRAGASVAVHPEVHAAGELRWHRAESELALRGESRARHVFVRSMLRARARLQGHDLRSAELVIAPSRRFARDLALDYALAPDRLAVLPNAIDLDSFHPPEPGERSTSPPFTLLYVGRFAVRKGLDALVELSHRLGDLAGSVELVVVGHPSQWSDYTHLLAGLHPSIGRVVRPTSMDEVRAWYRRGHLLLAPSRYEPFALTVGEALASGMPVAASDAVGAGEDIDRECCFVFPHGDVSALESTVRGFVEQAGVDGWRRRSTLARSEAERLFAIGSIGERLEHLLRAVKA
jgi:glycosyltransferase involved in cell wall biosynthesis